MRIRQESLLWRKVDDEGVVLDLEASLYLRANRSAAELWELLAEDRTEAELAAFLHERYGIAPARAESDVQAFVAALRARGVLDE
ncbi:MAG: PqqD family protein [Actinomycetota bacterium]|jgi:hypothetical protein|nr:PqqD family protein [Actinomycetota bacterium]